MRTSANERCDFCGETAVAFQRGASVCGRCGIERTLDHSGSPMRSRRMALVGLFSSGLLVKLMLGSVALAAVGSWAAATVMAPPPPIVISPPASVSEVISATTVVEVPARSDEPAISVEEVVSAAKDQAAKAHEFAAATQDWANCVSDAAISHRGGAFRPWGVRTDCPYPRPSDFGIGQGQGPPDTPPGWVHKLDNPGQSNDHDPNEKKSDGPDPRLKGQADENEEDGEDDE